MIYTNSYFLQFDTISDTLSFLYIFIHCLFTLYLALIYERMWLTSIWSLGNVPTFKCTLRIEYQTNNWQKLRLQKSTFIYFFLLLFYSQFSCPQLFNIVLSNVLIIIIVVFSSLNWESFFCVCIRYNVSLNEVNQQTRNERTKHQTSI